MEKQIPERPKRLTDAAAKRAAHRMLEILAQYNYPVAPDDYSVEAMAKIMSFSTQDGYDLARRMEDADILDRNDIDTVMVGLLDDDASHVLNDEIKNDFKMWVIENGIVPTMGVGDKVKVVDGYPDKDLRGQEGEIIEVQANIAKYVVMFPGLGHVGYGNGTGTCGTCLLFEVVEKI
jgi:hypothetical protein